MIGPFETPWERWSRDQKTLSHLTEAELQKAFVVFLERTVSNDRIVSIEGIFYEVPRSLGPKGRPRNTLLITYRILENTYHVQSDKDRLVRIHPVDLVANARSKRARTNSHAEEDVEWIPIPSAADLAFERDLGPVVDDEGNALLLEEFDDDQAEGLNPNEEVTTS
jgi:hypothetical protein